jgi:hypothetical protein
MQLSDRLTSLHCYTQTDSGLVQFGNALLVACGAVMSGNDDIIKEANAFSFAWRVRVSPKQKSSAAMGI